MALLSIPYAVAGAWVGLLQGYCYALKAVVEPLEPLVPAVAWITKPLAMVLPESAVHNHHAEGQAEGQPPDAGQAPPAASSSADSAAAPAAPDPLVPPSATAAIVHFSEPLVPGTPQAAAPAAAAEADRDAAAASMTAAAAAVAAAAEAAAAGPHAPTAERLERLQRNFAECRVDSFPIDNLSPTNTTGTAISSLLYTGGGLTPGGQTDYSAVAPLDEAVEGEMELTITHSTSNNSNKLWQPQQAAPAGDTDTAPPAPLDTAADMPAFGSGSRATDRSRQTDQTSPTKAARLQYNKAATAGVAGFAQPQQPGSSRSAYAVGRPAQRHQLQPRLSDGSTASSGSSHGAAAAAAIGSPASPLQPQQQQQQEQQQHKASSSSSSAAAAPAAAAGSSKLTVSLPAAAAAADLDGPLSPSSLSSIHTTDSMGTVERKKKRGLFASLKQKALKGRQQVR